MPVTTTPVMFQTSDGEKFESQQAAEHHEELLKAKRDYESSQRHLGRLLAKSQKTADGHPFDFGLRDYYYIRGGWDHVEPSIGRVSFWHHNWALADPRGKADEIEILAYDPESTCKIASRHRISELYWDEREAKRVWLERFREWVQLQQERLADEVAKTPEGKMERYWEYFRTAGKAVYGHGITAKRLERVKPLAFADRDLWAAMRRHGYPDDPAELDEHGRWNWSAFIHQIMIQHGILKV